MTPIRDSERDRYPANWSTEIRPAILDRAAGRCECLGECGHDHAAENAAIHPGHMTNGRCIARDRRGHPVTGSRVVLTVAHLDHIPENCDPENLRAMCQRCHLAYDRDHHAETRRKATLAKLGEPLW